MVPFMPQPARPRWLPVLEASAIALFAALAASLGWRLWTTAGVESWWVIAISVPIAFLLADLASGMVHWFCDTFFEEDSAAGRIFIAPFREHHRDPMALTRHGFLERNGNSSLAAVPPLGGAWWAEWPAAGSTLEIFGASVLLFLAVAVLVTNEIHRWAHSVAPPRAALWMQRRGLILSPNGHALHHATGSTAYCITLGWLNGPLDRMGFFDWSERALAALGVPRAGRRSPA